MAESKRRGEDAVGENLDEGLDDAVRDEAPGGTARSRSSREQIDDEPDDLDEDVEEEAKGLVRRNGKAPARAARGVPSKISKDRVAVDADHAERVGIFGRMGRFVREVVAELRKVIWPTRKELLTYTAVVVVFVTIILTIVGLLDLGFAKVVLYVFGGKK